MSVKRAIDLQGDLSRNASPACRYWWSRRVVTSLAAVVALAVLSACAGPAPEAPSKPTVEAVATQAVGTAQSGAATAVAGASPAAATVAAAASPVAATAQAAGAPVGATAVSVVGTAVGAISPVASPSPAAASLRIADASLADATPWVSIQNDGDTPIEIGGWRLQVGTASAELPQDAVVQPGAALTLHAGEGVNSDDELFLGDAGDVLASAATPGAPVRLTDGSGRVVTEVTVPRF